MPSPVAFTNYLQGSKDNHKIHQIPITVHDKQTITNKIFNILKDIGLKSLCSETQQGKVTVCTLPSTSTKIELFISHAGLRTCPPELRSG